VVRLAGPPCAPYPGVVRPPIPLKRIRMRSLLLPWALVLLGACSGQPEAASAISAGWTEYTGLEFSMQVPQNVHVTTREGPDFSVAYVLGEDSTTLLGVYSGGHPNFPSEHASDYQITRFRSGTHRGQAVRWQEADGSHSAEVLIRIRVMLSGLGDSEWFYHVWYHARPEDEVAVINNIIDSLRCRSTRHLTCG
jgi:hypothetical protein